MGLILREYLVLAMNMALLSRNYWRLVTGANFYRPSYNEIHPKYKPNTAEDFGYDIRKSINNYSGKLDIILGAAKKNIKELIDKGLIEHEGSVAQLEKVVGR